MTPTTTEPIHQDWTPSGLELTSDPMATAAEVNAGLARIEVADIDPQIVPFLAAAAAELAFLAGIPWRFSADDAPVALLRLIAKATMLHPNASGPHTARLVDQLC